MIEDLKHKLKNYKPYINGYKNMKKSFSINTYSKKKIILTIYYFKLDLKI